MKYKITGQISVFPLDANFHQCDMSDATHQLEIYNAGTRKIAFTCNFNNGAFSYPVGSQINFVPTVHSVDILLGKIKKTKENEK